MGGRGTSTREPKGRDTLSAPKRIIIRFAFKRVGDHALRPPSVDGSRNRNHVGRPATCQVWQSLAKFGLSLARSVGSVSDRTPQKHPEMPTPTNSGPEFVPASQAAVGLGVSSETIRQRVKSGALAGFQQPNRRWLVDRKALDAALAKLGKKTSSGGPDLATLAAELEQLRRQVDRLEGRARQSTGELASAIGERDRYRAEASTLRTVALHLNGTLHETAATLRTALAAAEEAQSEVLRAVLAPGSPQDLLE